MQRLSRWREPYDRVEDARPFIGSIAGLEGVRVHYPMMHTPDGSGRLELVKFDSPSYQVANRHAPGIRQLESKVEDIDDVVGRLRSRGPNL